MTGDGEDLLMELIAVTTTIEGEPAIGIWEEWHGHNFSVPSDNTFQLQILDFSTSETIKQEGSVRSMIHCLRHCNILSQSIVFGSSLSFLLPSISGSTD